MAKRLPNTVSRTRFTKGQRLLSIAAGAVALVSAAFGSQRSEAPHVEALPATSTDQQSRGTTPTPRQSPLSQLRLPTPGPALSPAPVQPVPSASTVDAAQARDTLDASVSLDRNSSPSEVIRYSNGVADLVKQSLDQQDRHQAWLSASTLEWAAKALTGAHSTETAEARQLARDIYNNRLGPEATSRIDQVRTTFAAIASERGGYVQVDGGSIDPASVRAATGNIGI